MIGLEVAPVAPRARLVRTRSGSTESSQSLVPEAMSDASGDVMASSFLFRWVDSNQCTAIRPRASPKTCYLGRCRVSGKNGVRLPVRPSFTIPGDLPVISPLPAVERRLTNLRRTTVVCRPRICAFRLTSAPLVLHVAGHNQDPRRQAVGTVKDAEEIALVVNRARGWIGVFMTATLLVGGVAAEDLPLPDPDGLELPYGSSSAMEFDGVPLPDSENVPHQPARPTTFPAGWWLLRGPCPTRLTRARPTSDHRLASR